MKKLIAILLMLALSLTVVACSDSKTTDDKSEGDTSNESQADQQVDFSAWTDVDMVNYMKAEGVFTEEDWLYTQTEGDEAPMGITKLISYMDYYGDADIMIFWLQPDAPTARTEEIYNEIKDTHNYIMTEAGNVPCPINAMFGRFAILYSFSLDPELVEKTEAALEKLTTEYGVTPDFYEKELEMPDYEDYYDDDYFDFDE